MTRHPFSSGFLAGMIVLALLMAAADGYRWGFESGLVRYECRSVK